ncbi:hypothetical protein [Roseovarius sp.]|uniref:hypothetical protein n=1 Tax=Roseovarius sp. TaxID=1486281 RepID=UPI003BACB106
MTLFLVNLSAVIEIEADTVEEAEDILDTAIRPICERGTVSFHGPLTEAEYEARMRRGEKPEDEDG